MLRKTIAIALTAIAGFSHASGVLNPGFEDLVNDQWVSVGGLGHGIYDNSGVYYGVTAHSGDYFAGILGSNDGVYLTNYTTQPLNVGDIVTISFWGLYTGNGSDLIFSAAGAFGSIVYDPATIQFFTPTAVGVWEQFTHTSTVGSAGWDSVMIASSGSWAIDDVSITVVPEPATVVALGAGLAAVARRRRK